LADLSVVLLVRRPSLPVPLGLVQVFGAPLGQIGDWPPPMLESLLDARGVDGVLDRVRDRPLLHSVSENQKQQAVGMMRARREGLPAVAGAARPCEPEDVLKLLTDLHRAGRLTPTQARILQRYGELGRQPSAHVAGERTDAELWRDALAELAAALLARGWLPPRKGGRKST
jgi:hypothetical protein